MEKPRKRAKKGGGDEEKRIEGMKYLSMAKEMLARGREEGKEVTKVLRKAAKLGNGEACWFLGYMYNNKWCGLVRSKKQYIRYYKLAAELGNERGMFQCAWSWWGPESNVGPDERARYIAAMLKCNDAYCIGWLYSAGSSNAGITRDTAIAHQWFLKAAEAGDMVAQHKVSTNYKYMKSVRDVTEYPDAMTVVWCAESANLGHMEAQHVLGCLYMHGTLIEPNYEKAWYWFKRCIRQHRYSRAHKSLLWPGFNVFKDFDAIRESVLTFIAIKRFNNNNSKNANDIDDNKNVRVLLRLVPLDIVKDIARLLWRTRLNKLPSSYIPYHKLPIYVEWMRELIVFSNYGSGYFTFAF